MENRSLFVALGIVIMLYCIYVPNGYETQSKGITAFEKYSKAKTELEISPKPVVTEDTIIAEEIPVDEASPAAVDSVAVVALTRGPDMEFQSMKADLGTLKQGDKTKHTFHFKNTGDKPLSIIEVKASCGCTRPSYPFVDIAPGKTGKIEVVYDSEGKLGEYDPVVNVHTNVMKTPYRLEMKVKVYK